jgi:putative copper export protein
VLSPTVATWRLALHVLAAAVWVGGQLALAGIVPTLRKVAPDATKAAARAFARLSWPAFALAVITGIWNLSEIGFSHRSTSYQVTLFVKIAFAAVSGSAAAVHQLGRTKVALAVGGALALVGALGALFLGVLLLTGTS